MLIYHVKIHISTVGCLVHYQKDKGLLNPGEGIPEKQSTPLWEGQGWGQEQCLSHFSPLGAHLEQMIDKYMMSALVNRKDGNQEACVPVL